MNKFTSEDYIRAVKEAVENAKSGPDAGRWLNASPAQMRNWCQQVYENLENDNDRRQFDIFFQFPKGIETAEKIDRAFQQFQLGKFKAVRNFINGTSEKPNPTIVELLAVLADFKKRPYANFRKCNTGSYDSPIASNRLNEEGVFNLVNSKGGPDIAEITQPVLRLISSKNNKRWKVTAIIVFALLLGGLAVAKLMPEKPACMFWNENQYEGIDCNSQVLGFESQRKIVPGQEHLLKRFKKVAVSPKTIFFKNGKAVIWYGKNESGVYEYFTCGGEHPETSKYLKPITNYHINKYVNSNK